MLDPNYIGEIRNRPICRKHKCLEHIHYALHQLVVNCFTLIFPYVFVLSKVAGLPRYVNPVQLPKFEQPAH